MAAGNTFSGLLPNFKQTYSDNKGNNMSEYKPQGKLGSGERFKHLKAVLAKKPGITNPGALASAIGRKKFGQAKMTKMAEAGKHRHEK